MDFNSFLASFGKKNIKSEYGLDTIKSIMALFNDPQDLVPSVHIAGTNGKGSVGVMTSAIIAQNGYNVGYSCSPHLTKVNERLIINGYAIEDRRLEEICLLLREKLRLLDLAPSFFEIMTAIAFLAFKGLDYAVYEAGLGGRLDATNILSKPRVSIITSIAYDHEKILGNTLAAICTEKAGIMRENSVMVVGSLNSSCMEVINDKARAMKTKVLALGQDFFIEKVSDYADESYLYRDLKQNEFIFTPSLRGAHQGENAALAIASCIELNMSIEACKKGVNSAFIPGRLEYIKYQHRELILDCAHNPAGMEKLTSFLDSVGIKEIDLIYSSLDTKNWRVCLQLLKGYIVNWYILEVNSEASVKSEDILNYLKSLDIHSVKSYSRNIDKCLAETCSSEAIRPLLVTGSMYVLGEIRGLLKRQVSGTEMKDVYWTV
jgi:dihydrofolate synthase/folylpolyglutamate synthase